MAFCVVGKLSQSNVNEQTNNTFVFKQDCIFRSRVVFRYLRKKRVKYWTGLKKNPDLNTIQNLWSYMESMWQKSNNSVL